LSATVIGNTRAMAHDLPSRKTEAITRLSIIDGRRGREAQWQWYYACIRQMLAEVGCPPGEIDDAAHDLIVGKLDAIFSNYEAGKGRFRGYLYRAVRNAWLDIQRARGRESTGRSLTDVDDGVAQHEDDSGDQLSVLQTFFDRVFAHYAREHTATELGFFLFRDWCLFGRDVETSIEENSLDISANYGMQLRAEAVKRFADFVFQCLDQDDFQLLVADAEAAGYKIGAYGDVASIAAMFRWPSESKRLGQVALLLRHLFAKYKAFDGGFDEL
jgi:hypothetical protein